MIVDNNKIIKNNSASRSEYWDIVKGGAILLMILGHSIQWSDLSDKDFFRNPIFKFIYGFHMPLFAIISGIFFFVSQHNNVKTIIINRCRQCILPIITITLCIDFINNIFIPKLIILSFFQNFWFLWSIFFLSCIVLLVHNLFNDNICVYILLFCFSFVLPEILISKHIYFLYPFFCIGV